MKRRTIVIDGVHYYAERPHDCRKCFFWKNRKVGCSLGSENCYYLAEVVKTEQEKKCENCPYAKGAPCVTASCYKDLEKWLRDRRAKTVQRIMPDEKKQFEELTIKFGKGLAEDFTGKDGKAYKRILIPNADPADHSPWASFVLPAKAVHENQYGKGLWAKIPAEGHTTVTKPERTDGIDGEIVWENRKESVPNAELKGMVESYKTRSPQTKETGSRESAREKLDSLAKKTAAKLSPEGRKAKPKDRGPEH